ncbi:MAG TPA: phosphoadenylyl-sulfate reductase [Chitinophagaceae bacterium]|nr:phosphoadenylyl-sulfate reductase [Chitinophagaceae bacterium]
MGPNKEQLIAEILDQTQNQDISATLQWLALRFAGKTVFSSSLGLEDQVISHLIYDNELPIDQFTLDTGRLFSETYALMERMQAKYGRRIKVYFPQHDAVEQLVNEKGPNSFYSSVENRKACCHIRKVEPLDRALEGKACWITGIRADQSAGRSNLSMVEWDDAHGLVKVHPLLYWTLDEVKDFIAIHQVSYNPLHDRGFGSIGCAPCTRAIRPGEDIRAGRWWWEQNSGKECGLHVQQERINQA